MLAVVVQWFWIADIFIPNVKELLAAEDRVAEDIKSWSGKKRCV